MTVIIPPDRLEVLPGKRLCLHQTNWQQLEDLLHNLGDKRPTRIAFYQGSLEIRMPSPEHERAKVIISDLLKILLDCLGMEWESLGSTTFKKQESMAGIEPDDCFYIRNYRSVIGIKRIDLSIDPPPDLAIEIDLTSPTQISAYSAIGVGEVWRYDRGKLLIYLLQSEGYQQSDRSLIFPDLPIVLGISEFLTKGATMPMSGIRREFRQWLENLI